MKKEASARIKIYDLLKESGWRYFDEKGEKANIILENQTKITQKMIDEYGHDFEFSSKGFIDFQQLDEHSHPIIVLEAKSEKHNPLMGKEQARAYAKSSDFGEVSQLHAKTSIEIWNVRELLLSLLIDMNDNRVSFNEAQTMRDDIHKLLYCIYEKAMRNSERAYNKATKALKDAEEMYFSTEEIDSVLPST